MRNLLEYPITQREVVDTLQDYIDADLQKGFIGGTQTYILGCLKTLIEREFHHDDFNPTVKDTDGKSAQGQ
jgi:hypothetical protein